MERVATSDLARYIDHSVLRPDARSVDIEEAADACRRYGFAALCVNSTYVAHASQWLEGSNTVVCATVAFPFGTVPASVRLEEASYCLSRGARELDMVMNLGAARSDHWDVVRDEIRSVAHLAHEKGAILKVILENCYLTDEEKRRGCEVAVAAEADFVKTSTGFGAGGAKLEDVALMRQIVGPHMGIKAAGGIRTRAQAEAFIRAGATRIGTSAGPRIVDPEGEGV